jgi:hypothetical protein
MSTLGAGSVAPHGPRIRNPQRFAVGEISSPQDPAPSNSGNHPSVAVRPVLVVSFPCAPVQH